MSQDTITTDLEMMYQWAKNTPGNINEHIPVLFEYAKQCQTITELGTGAYPVSSWGFLRAKPKKFTTIDASDPSLIPEAKKIAADNSIEFEFIKADTGNPDLVLEETDLLFIDTWHTYDQLKQEFKLHANKARKYIVLHDTTTFGNCDEGFGAPYYPDLFVQPSSGRGIWPVVEEFLVENTNWSLVIRYTNNNGLTVLKRIE